MKVQVFLIIGKGTVSSSLRILTGLSPASAGGVLWHGQSVQGDRLMFRSCFKVLRFSPWLTGPENFEAPLESRGLRPVERHKRALRIIDAVGFDGFENAYPREFSGGMNRVPGAKTKRRLCSNCGLGTRVPHARLVRNGHRCNRHIYRGYGLVGAPVGGNFCFELQVVIYVYLAFHADFGHRPTGLGPSAH